jgi:hypothetical protein
MGRRRSVLDGWETWYETLVRGFFHRGWFLIQLIVINGVTRVLDVVVLLPRPTLLWAYLRMVVLHTVSSPYHDFGPAGGRSSTELVYGETPVVTGIALFRRAGVGPGSTLVDLGAGRGRALLAARWLGAEARGVELLAEHVDCTERALAVAGARLERGDVAEVDLHDATHILITWTVYAPATREQVAARLAGCRAGTRVLAVDSPVERPELEVVDLRHAYFTWGRAPVWIQEVRS